MQAGEDPRLFWELASSWSPPPGSDAQQCWDALQDAAAQHLSPAMRKVFAVSLAVRQYSAHMQMLRQLAAESQPAGACCWAVIGGQVVTDAAAVPGVTAAAAPLAPGKGDADGARVYAFDHLYQGSGQPEVNVSDPSIVPAVLYAPLGSVCGQQFHAQLARAAGGLPQLAYAWRPVPAEGCPGAGDCAALGTGGRLVLPGYGVEMAIKNMEYNARDDSKKVMHLMWFIVALPLMLCLACNGDGAEGQVLPRCPRIRVGPAGMQALAARRWFGRHVGIEICGPAVLPPQQPSDDISLPVL